MNERSPFRVLFWACAAATALVAGYIAVAGGPEAVDPSWTGVFGLCLGATVLALAADGAATGRIRVRRSHARREERPVTFWAVVALYGATGAAIAGAAAWHLLGG